MSSRKAVATKEGLGGYTSKMPSSFAGQMESMPQNLLSHTTQRWPSPGLQPQHPDHFDGSPNPASRYDTSPRTYLDTQHSYSPNLYSTHLLEMSLPIPSIAAPFVASQRSSLSSAPGSESRSHSEGLHSFHPQVKLEDSLGWSPEDNLQLLMASSQDNLAIVARLSPSQNQSATNASFLGPQGQQSWNKVDGRQGGSFYQTSPNSGLNESNIDRSSELLKAVGNGDRTRLPRKMTTKEDANFQCKVEGCGKLFSRSYNYKAHMETHDTSRLYPFPCYVSGCKKKFVRKTDLQRHHQSVHMKERNHQCDFCSRYFARKDTLRRHMDDGCSKRFDLDITFNDGYRTTTANDSKSGTRIESLHSPYMSNSVEYGSTHSGTSSSPPPAAYASALGFMGDIAQSPSWVDGYDNAVENELSEFR